MKEYWKKLIGHKMQHHFQLFLCVQFFQMQAAVHFPQIEQDSSKLQTVQGIVQHFSQQFREYYFPNQQVSIDESMICFEGRRQHSSPQVWI